MKYVFIVFLWAVILSGCSSASSNFKVGTSQVSLEPDQSIFSLALAGYGFPGEGRFTLEWIEKESTPDIVYLTGLDNTLYGINSDGTLFRFVHLEGHSKWMEMKSSQVIQRIAALQNALFAVTSDNHFWTGIPEKSGITWKRLDSSLQNVVALSATGKYLYAATQSDELFEGVVGEGYIAWSKIGSAQSVIGLAGYKDYLYALTSNQMLWRRKASTRDIPWTKIGYNNGYTYNLDIKQIAVSGDRLYAIGMNQRLYLGQHRSNGNLYAKALAIQKGDQTAVIVGVDLTGFDYSLISEIKNEIYRQKGIPAEAILVNASHTHFAPVSQGWYSWSEPNQYPDTLYLEQIVKPRIIEAAIEAVNRLRPAKLYFGSATTTIGGNRCLLGEEALYDPTVDVVKVESSDQKLEEVLFLTGCHPVFRNAEAECFTLNANFPAAASEIIQQKSEAPHSLFLQGCAGDINPLHEDYRKMGSILAEDVLEVLEKPMDLITGGISYAMDSILVPVHPWSVEKIESFKKENSAHPGNLEAEKNVRWANLMLERHQTGTMPRYMPIYVQTLNIGNWKLIGLSREAVAQYGMEIRSLWPDQHVSVAGYCNDVSSYLPAAAHIRAQTYEGYGSFLWYSQPGFFPENILEQVVATIKENNR